MDSDSSTLDLVGQPDACDEAFPPAHHEEATPSLQPSDRTPSEAQSEISELAREGVRLLHALEDGEAKKTVSRVFTATPKAR